MTFVADIIETLRLLLPAVNQLVRRAKDVDAIFGSWPSASRWVPLTWIILICTAHPLESSICSNRATVDVTDFWEVILLVLAEVEGTSVLRLLGHSNM